MKIISLSVTACHTDFKTLADVQSAVNQLAGDCPNFETEVKSIGRLTKNDKRVYKYVLFVHAEAPVLENILQVVSAMETDDLTHAEIQDASFSNDFSADFI